MHGLIRPSTATLLWRAVAVLALAAMLAGCEATRNVIDSRPSGLGGRIVPLGGSAAKGFIIVKRREGGVTLIVNLNDMRPDIYRVVFHANGNCKSHNGFSAGPPWAPPGGQVEVYSGWMNADGLLSMSIPISGLPIEAPDGIYGRSVVIHQGNTGSLDAIPDVRNDRIACVVLSDAPEMEL